MMQIYRTLGCLCLAVLLMGSGARCEEPQGIVLNGKAGRLHIAADPRPLPAALHLLSRTFSWRIGFEEARLAYPGDLVDMTSPTYAPKSPDDRAFDPRGGALDIEFAVNERTQLPDEPTAVIRALLTEYERRGYPGKYSFTSEPGAGGYIYVFPEAAANTSGALQKATPVTTTRITVSVQENQKLGSVLKETCKLLQQKAGIRVLYVGHGGAVQTEFRPAPPVLAARDEPAYLFLNRAVAAVGFSYWQLVYDPGAKWYLLAYG